MQDVPGAVACESAAAGLDMSLIGYVIRGGSYASKPLLAMYVPERGPR